MMPATQSVAAWVLVTATIPTASNARADAPVEPVRWEGSFSATAFDGSPVVGVLGRLSVPERYDTPDGPRIDLAFVRYETTNPNAGPPVFFLAGGPGGSGVELAAHVATHPQIRLLEHCDVIGIDQRGAGLTRPNLTDGAAPDVQLPLDRAVDRADVIAAMTEAVRECTASWLARGVDLRAYDSVASAADLDALRVALGLDRVILYGSSYGSHLGLAYLRRYEEHVARALLMNVEGPDHTWKLPSTVQRHLEQVHEQVASDPVFGKHIPDLLGLVRGLLQQLADAPVVVVLHEGDANEMRVTLGPHDLQVELSRALSTATGVAALPAMLLRLEAGDWTDLAPSAAANRHIEVLPMAIAMDCASGGTAARLARIERERADPANVLGDAILTPLYPPICAGCGNPGIGDAFRAPFSCDVPVLFVSGTLDVRTPPENVEEIRAGFSNHTHVIVENAGHESRELMSPEYRDLMQAFLRGEDVESCRIALPRVFFDTVVAGGDGRPGPQP